MLLLPFTTRSPEGPACFALLPRISAFGGCLLPQPCPGTWSPGPHTFVASTLGEGRGDLSDSRATSGSPGLSLARFFFFRTTLLSTEAWGGSVCNSRLESGFVFLLLGDLQFELSLFQTILRVGSVQFSCSCYSWLWMACGVRCVSAAAITCSYPEVCSLLQGYGLDFWELNVPSFDEQW